MYPQEQVINFIDEIIENISSSGVFVLDRKTMKIITSNDAFAQIHGYDTKTDVNGLVLWDLFLPIDMQSPLRTLEQKGYFQGEVRAFTRGRDIISLDLTILDIQRFKIILGLVREKDIDLVSDTRGALLKMMMSETSEQLLLTRGWLDILQASFPEQHERVEKLIGIIEKVIRLNRQISEFETLKPVLEFPLLLVSIQKFMVVLNELVKSLIHSKRCTIKFNLQLEQTNLYSCPRILTIAVEQIIRNSLERSCSEITIDIGLTSENNMELIITDNGKTFLQTPESPDTSKFLLDIYLADVLLREIGGKVTVSDILPKEGLQFSLICPLKSDD